MSFKEIEELKESREYKAADALTDALNTFSWDEEKFAAAIGMQHRTLQQSVMRTMIAVIRFMASDDYRYDGRNEASHNTAKKIVESGAIGEGYIPCI